MSSNQKSPLNVVFGAMTFGVKGAEQARVHTLEDCNAILDIFQAHGHNEIDTARTYADGTSESFLGDLDWAKRGLVMETKYYPTGAKPSIAPKDAPEGGWRHTPEHLRENLLASLKALKTEKIDLWYLHGPDRTTPYEITLRAVNELHKEGYFSRFGVSNFAAWEVAQMCEICEKNGWIKPTVYQGVYNAFRRDVEAELFPCLQYYGVAFYVFNPLAGGLLTSRYQREAEVEEGSRFDPGKIQGKQYRARYWNDAYFDALDILRPMAKKHGLSEAECALRWMNHHSLLKREKRDAIIIGASSTKHIEENLRLLEDLRPLPKEVVKALDEGWARVKGVSASYFH